MGGEEGGGRKKEESGSILVHVFVVGPFEVGRLEIREVWKGWERAGKGRKEGKRRDKTAARGGGAGDGGRRKAKV